MKLPPDDSNDITPTENLIVTVDLGVPPPQRIVTSMPRIDAHTLARARLGAHDSAFREFARICVRYWRWVAFGAGVALGCAGAVAAAILAWIKWGR